jgi:hypothetical protein
VDLNTFITAIFCPIDDWLKEQRIHRRGPAPKLADSEVLTVEVIDEFLGIETDKGLYDHFRRYYTEWFSVLAKVHRTTPSRRAYKLPLFTGKVRAFRVGTVPCREIPHI